MRSRHAAHSGGGKDSEPTSGINSDSSLSPFRSFRAGRNLQRGFLGDSEDAISPHRWPFLPVVSAGFVSSEQWDPGLPAHPPTPAPDVLGPAWHRSLCWLCGLEGGLAAAYRPGAVGTASPAGPAPSAGPGASAPVEVLGQLPVAADMPGHVLCLQDAHSLQSLRDQPRTAASRRGAKRLWLQPTGNLAIAEENGGGGERTATRTQGLTVAGPAVQGECVAAVAATLEAARLVVANLAADPALLAALIDIWEQDTGTERARGDPQPAWSTSQRLHLRPHGIHPQILGGRAQGPRAPTAARGPPEGSNHILGVFCSSPLTLRTADSESLLTPF